MSFSRDPQVTSALRRHLNWPEGPLEPSLLDLHPSLGNLDHLDYLINLVKQQDYPHGVGFNGTSVGSLIRFYYILMYFYGLVELGAKALLEYSNGLPTKDRYIRFAEEVELPSGMKTPMVICMSPKQSTLFHSAKRLGIDASFGGVVSWKEFEIETWHAGSSRCKHGLLFSPTLPNFLIRSIY